MEQHQARAVSASCSMQMGMPSQFRRCARRAIQCSTKLPFRLFTIGVRNQGGSGVWLCQLRLNHSAAGENPAEMAKPKNQAPKKPGNPGFQLCFGWISSRNNRLTSSAIPRESLQLKRYVRSRCSPCTATMPAASVNCRSEGVILFQQSL